MMEESSSSDDVIKIISLLISIYFWFKCLNQTITIKLKLTITYKSKQKNGESHRVHDSLHKHISKKDSVVYNRTDL
jgi:hypothetical protein